MVVVYRSTKESVSAREAVVSCRRYTSSKYHDGISSEILGSVPQPWSHTFFYIIYWKLSHPSTWVRRSGTLLTKSGHRFERERLEILACSKKRMPAHGWAVWPGLYETVVSPICSNKSTHLVILLKRSRRITASPFFRIYFHLFATHRCLDFSASSRRSDRSFSLSLQLKLIFRRSWSDSLTAARAHRSLLKQTRGLAHSANAVVSENRLPRGWCEAQSQQSRRRHTSGNIHHVLIFFNGFSL